MDGLMFDTERLALEGWMLAAGKLNIALSEEQIASLRGLLPEVSRQKFIGWFGDGAIYDKGRDIRKAYVEQWIEEHGMPVKKGLFELLEYLKEKQIRTAVATSTNRPAAEHYWACAGGEAGKACSRCISDCRSPDWMRAGGMPRTRGQSQRSARRPCCGLHSRHGSRPGRAGRGVPGAVRLRAGGSGPGDQNSGSTVSAADRITTDRGSAEPCHPGAAPQRTGVPR